MREVTSSTWTFSLIITFMFLFSAFLALSITYSKVFKLKNEVLTILEKYEGLTSESHEIINNLLLTSNYKTTGHCKDVLYAEDDLNSNPQYIKKSEANKKYYYCLESSKTSNPNIKDKVYYDIKLFFKFNLPIFGELTSFDINGRTKLIKVNQNKIIHKEVR